MACMKPGTRGKRRATSRTQYIQAMERALAIALHLEATGDLHQSLDVAFSKDLPSQVRGMATGLAYTLAARWGVVDRVLEEVQGESLSHSTSLLRAALRVGAIEVLWQGKNPLEVSQALGEALKERTSSRIIPRIRWVLKRVANFPLPRPGTFPEHAFWTYFFPPELAQKLKGLYGESGALHFMAFVNQEKPPTTLRANRLKISREELAQRLAEKGITTRPSTLAEGFLVLESSHPVMRLEEFREGLFTIQDQASGLAVARLLEKGHPQAILDACAAPGRKTGHLRELAPRAILVAMDLSLSRLARAREELDRLEHRASIMAADATRPPFKEEVFSHILLDAPCSGSGTLWSHPERRWFSRGQDLEELSRVQGKMLEALFPMLKPGGRLLYATCSLWREENEEVIQGFLTSHPRANLVSQERLAPHTHGTTGFYMAVVEKPSS